MQSQKAGSDLTSTKRSLAKSMNDLEYQESLSKMTIPELIESIVQLTETYNEHLTMLTHEILTRSMQKAN